MIVIAVYVFRFIKNTFVNFFYLFDLLKFFYYNYAESELPDGVMHVPTPK